MQISTRWMIGRDFPDVLAIEAATCPQPFRWDHDSFAALRKLIHCAALVAESGGRIVAFMVYEMHRDRIAVLKLAVAPMCQRRGVGRQLFRRLQDKLVPGKRHEIVVTVHGANLDAQAFLESMGCRCCDVTPGGDEGDIYVMQWLMPESNDVDARIDRLFRTESHNRVWEHIDKVESQRRGEERKRRAADQ